ncbi:MAG: CRTAC1 family protein [Proteobacteria bacterium]|nr:CRTAC1 family protein [Pseudomonadota bacterium]
MRRLSLILLAAFLTACPTEEPPPVQEEDPTPEPFDTSGYEVISYELTEKDGEAYKGTDDAENAWSAVRYHLDTPMRIVAIGAMFNVRGDDDKPAHLALWPDQGHNFINWDRANPLAEWELDLTKDEHDEVWQVLPLDEPVDIAWPQLVWLGHHYQGEIGQPVLAADSDVSPDPYLLAHAGENDQYPPHVVALPDRPDDAIGAEAFAWGDGDLQVKLYVERYNVTGDDEKWFADRTDTEDQPTGVGLAGSGSVSFGDCNDDGWIDVFDGRLRVNNGDGTFTDAHDASGITHGGNAMWGDFDNDGDLDVFMGRWDDKLYANNGDCTFVDVTELSGIDDTQSYTTGDGTADQHTPTVATAWVDVDGDGLLDLYHSNFGDFGTADWALDFLWHNQGDGTFVDVTDSAGMRQPQGTGKAARTVGPADWDNDGDMDIYVGNYRLHRNFGYSNDSTPGEPDFTEVADGTVLEGTEVEAGSLQYYYGHTIGMTWGDVDNDGDLDAFIGNLAHPRFIEWSDWSMFLRNELTETGSADFTDVREESGMLYQETDSSPMLFDYDNDGFLDLFYTTVYPSRPSYLYRNNQDWTFTMVSYEAHTWIYGGWGVSYADVDNDGDQEIYGGRFFDNRGVDGNNWVKVKAVGSGTGFTNTSGIGTRVTVEVEDRTIMREVRAGIGVGCQQPLEQHIGLGQAEIATVTVSFPVTGETVEITDVAAGERLVVYEDGTVLSR